MNRNIFSKKFETNYFYVIKKPGSGSVYWEKGGIRIRFWIRILNIRIRNTEWNPSKLIMKSMLCSALIRLHSWDVGNSIFAVKKWCLIPVQEWKSLFIFYRNGTYLILFIKLSQYESSAIDLDCLFSCKDLAFPHTVPDPSKNPFSN